MYTKGQKNAEYVKHSVPIGAREAVYVDAQPDMENCSNGLAPQPNAAADGVRRMKVPVVQTMTKDVYKRQLICPRVPAVLKNSL